MPKKIYFMGILANIDPSILALNEVLEHGFKINSMNFKDFAKFISSLNHMSEEVFYTSDIFHSIVTDNGDLYYIENSFELNDDISENVEASIFLSFDDNKVESYLISLLRVMRLYKEGNIVMPYYFYYLNYKDSFISYIAPEIEHSVFNETYILNKSEITNLKLFIRNNTVDFENKSLKLGFNDFELSYQVQESNLQFIILMNALEILLKPSSAETDLTYRLSRNGAVLLGKNKNESEVIYKDLKCLYAIRSSIVHMGEAKDCKKRGNKRPILDYAEMNEKTRLLRNYVRSSIIKLDTAMRLTKKSKDDILNSLNSLGFGENH